jgi:hypothetical protein
VTKRPRARRGGLYWFFKDRAQMLQELLDYWVGTGAMLFEKVLRTPRHSGMEYFASRLDSLESLDPIRSTTYSLAIRLIT